jgi:hypothetical protein
MTDAEWIERRIAALYDAMDVLLELDALRCPSPGLSCAKCALLERIENRLSDEIQAEYQAQTFAVLETAGATPINLG